MILLFLFPGNPKESGGDDLDLSTSAFFSICIVETKEKTVEKENLKTFSLRDYIFRVDSNGKNLAENEKHANMLKDKILQQTAIKMNKLPRSARLDTTKKILLLVNPKSGPGT